MATRGRFVNGEFILPEIPGTNVPQGSFVNGEFVLPTAPAPSGASLFPAADPQPFNFTLPAVDVGFVDPVNPVPGFGPGSDFDTPAGTGTSDLGFQGGTPEQGLSFAQDFAKGAAIPAAAFALGNPVPAIGAVAGVLAGDRSLGRSVSRGASLAQSVAGLSQNFSLPGLALTAAKAFGFGNSFSNDIDPADLAAQGFETAVGAAPAFETPEITGAPPAFSQVDPDSGFDAGFGPDQSGGQTGFSGEGIDGSDADGGGDGDGWVVCTELNQQGMMPLSLLRVGVDYMESMNPITLRGYWFWGVPYAGLMRRRPVFARIAAPIALARARHIRDGKGVWGAVCKCLVEWPSWLIGICLEVTRRKTARA